jgi:hypothetical protein
VTSDVGTGGDLVEEFRVLDTLLDIVLDIPGRIKETLFETRLGFVQYNPCYARSSNLCLTTLKYVHSYCTVDNLRLMITQQRHQPSQHPVPAVFPPQS